MNWYTHTTQKQSQKKAEIYFPENIHVLEKIVVGRLLCFRNDPFLGDMCVLVCVVWNFRDLINMKHFFEASASAGWHSTVHRSWMENHMNFNMGRKQKYWSFLGSTWKTIQETWFSWRKTCMENQSCQGSEWFQVTSQWNPGNCKQLTSWSDTSRSHAR